MDKTKETSCDDLKYFILEDILVTTLGPRLTRHTSTAHLVLPMDTPDDATLILHPLRSDLLMKPQLHGTDEALAATVTEPLNAGEMAGFLVITRSRSPQKIGTATVLSIQTKVIFERLDTESKSKD